MFSPKPLLLLVGLWLTAQTAFPATSATKLVVDSYRPRVYALFDNYEFTSGYPNYTTVTLSGSLTVRDTQTNQPAGTVVTGRRPTDLAISPDGSDLAFINSFDASITIVDATSLQVKETIALPGWSGSNNYLGHAHLAYGKGDILYFTDAVSAPTLYVYKRSTQQIIQQRPPTGNGGTGPIALSPDGKFLYAQAQVTWSGLAGSSSLATYVIADDGTLSILDKYAGAGAGAFGNPDWDDAVLVDSRGQTVFAKQLALKPDKLSFVKRIFPGSIRYISAGGELVGTSAAVYDGATGELLYNTQISGRPQALTPDGTKLFYGGDFDTTINAVDLTAVLPAAKFPSGVTPPNGAVTVPPAALTWAPGPAGSHYRVYLGDSEAAVQGATTASAEYRGEFTDPSFPVGGALTEGQTYYWRYDLVTAYAERKGLVSSFRVEQIGLSALSLAASTVQGVTAQPLYLQLASNAPVAWQAESDQPWVKFASASGSSPGTLTLLLDTIGLALGSQTANVTVKLPGGKTLATIPVSLQVDPFKPGKLISDRASASVYTVSQVNFNAAAYVVEIDSASRTLLRAFRSGTSARDVAISDAENRVYVSNSSTGELLSFDKTTFVPVRSYPYAPAPVSNTPFEPLSQIAAGKAGVIAAEVQVGQSTDHFHYLDTGTGEPGATGGTGAFGDGEFSIDGSFYFRSEQTGANWTLQRYGGAPITPASAAAPAFGSTHTVYPSEDGQLVFWAGNVYDQNLNLVAQNAGTVPLASDGHLTYRNRKVYDRSADKDLFALPTDLTAIVFNSTSGRVVMDNGATLQFLDLAADPAQPVPAPVLSLGAAYETSVALKWNDRSPFETAFTLEGRLAGDTAWQDFATLPANTISYVVPNLTSQTSYEFRLRADNGSQSSNWSNLLAVTTTGHSGEPPLVDFGGVSNITTATAGAFTNITPQGSSTTFYVEYGPTPALGSFTDLATLSSTTVQSSASAWIGGLAPATLYYYRFVAANANGLTVGVTDTFYTHRPADTNPPFAFSPSVASVSATAARIDGQIQTVGSDTQYFVEYGASNPAEQQSAVASIPGAQIAVPVSVQLTGLTPSTTYYYHLRATGPSGTGASTLGSFTTSASDPSGTPPVVSALGATNVTTNSALLTASVNPSGLATTSVVEYGTYQLNGSQATNSPGSGTEPVFVGTQITNLTADTIYHYRIRASNSAGTTYSEIGSFTTVSTNPPAAPEVSFASAVNITSSGAQISTSIHPHKTATTFVVEYGTTTSLGQSTAPASAGSGAAYSGFSAQLSGLSANTKYYFLVRATNSLGSNATTISSFTTLPPPGAPDVTLTGATNVLAGTASVNGSVNPRGVSTTVVVEYDTTPTGFSQSTAGVAAGSATSASPISVPLSGLLGSTTYYVRLRATNSLGSNVTSASSFTTAPPVPPDAAVIDVTSITTSSASVNLVVNPHSLITDFVVEYDTTPSAFSQSTAGVSAGEGTKLTPLSAPIGGLVANTAYYCRGRATSSGGVTYTVPFSFTTRATDSPPLPLLAFTTLSNVTSNGATVQGLANPNGSATALVLDYGTTPALGQSTAPGSIGSGTSEIAVAIQHLGASNTTYYFRLRATNAGGTVVSATSGYSTLVGGARPPIISSSSVSEVAAHSAQVNATINGEALATTFVVQYGVASSLGQQTTASSVPSGPEAFPVGATLTALVQNTTYYYRVAATNSAGTALTTIASFTTPAGAVLAPAISNVVASHLTTTGVKIDASINPEGDPTTFIVEYGLTNSLGQQTAAATVPAGSSPAAVAAQLTGLAVNTTYYYRVSATNSGGTSLSAIGNLSTAGGGLAPSISNVVPSNATSTGVDIGASINPNGNPTTFIVSYGLTTSLGQQTAPATVPDGTTAAAMTAQLSGLTQNTTYYFRVSATNSAGTTLSAIGSVTTLREGSFDSPFISAYNVAEITQSSAQVQADVVTRNGATTVVVDYGTSGTLSLSTSPQTIPSSNGQATVVVPLAGLYADTVYSWQLRASNESGTTTTPIGTFRTARTVIGSPPGIGTVTTGYVTLTAASLGAYVQPRGFDTSLVAEYGTDNSTPLATSAVVINGGYEGLQYVSISNLTPATHYYYRLRATSAAGTSYSPVQSFTTPPYVEPDVTANPDYVLTLPGHAVSIDVLANDLSKSGEALQVLTVGPAHSGTARLVASGRIVYTPGPGYSAYGDSFNYTVADQHDHTATGRVSISKTDFVAAGNYSALLGATGGDFQHTGAITVSLTALGAVSGKLSFGGGVWPFRTQISSDGSIKISVARPGQSPLGVNLQFSPPTRSLGGRLIAGGEATDFNCRRGGASAPAAVAGRYTLLLPYEDATQPTLHGLGFATLHLGNNGSTQIVGRTAAGAPFSAGAFVSQDEHRLPLYATVSLPRRTSFHGWMQFREVAETSDLDGQLGWSDAAGHPVVISTAIGSRYTAPSGNTLALPFPRGTPNARIDLWNGADHLTPNPLRATLTPRALTGNESALRGVTFAPETGLFSGSVLLDGKLRSFFGVVFQAQGLGAGPSKTADGTAALQLIDPAHAISVDNLGVSLAFPPAEN